MSEIMLQGIIKDAIVTAIKVAAPILLSILCVGLIISIIQATTQIQEQTLTFVPKVLLTVCIGLFLGSWMLETLMGFVRRVFDLITVISS